MIHVSSFFVLLVCNVKRLETFDLFNSGSRNDKEFKNLFRTATDLKMTTTIQFSKLFPRFNVFLIKKQYQEFANRFRSAY